MTISVSIHTVPARQLAVVRRRVRLGDVAGAWRPALDQVWAFLRERPGLRTDGDNVFLYHHPASRDAPMEVDFGVEVTRDFEPAGEVFPTRTPVGEAAVAVHVGAYSGLRATHDAIHDWARENKREFASQSWEIYGDWDADETKLETSVVYLLR